jgi:hypothetical protein
MVAVAMLLPAAASAQGAHTTCSFALTRLDATTTNALAVDTNAVYWGGTYAGFPGTRIRIEGEYPHGPAFTADECRELQAPYAQPINDLIAGASGLADPTDDAQGYPGRNPPNWRLFQNLCGSAVDVLLGNEDGEALHDDAYGRCGNGPGFLSNRDIAYVFAPTSRGFGDLLVLRGRAPTSRIPDPARPSCRPGRSSATGPSASTSPRPSG